MLLDALGLLGLEMEVRHEWIWMQDQVRMLCSGRNALWVVVGTGKLLRPIAQRADRRNVEARFDLQ